MPDRLKAILEKIKESKRKTILIINNKAEDASYQYYGCSNSCIGDTGCRDDETYDGSADNL